MLEPWFAIQNAIHYAQLVNPRSARLIANFDAFILINARVHNANAIIL